MENDFNLIYGYCVTRMRLAQDQHEDLKKFIMTTKGLYELMDILDDPQDKWEAFDWWWYLNKKDLKHFFPNCFAS